VDLVTGLGVLMVLTKAPWEAEGQLGAIGACTKVVEQQEIELGPPASFPFQSTLGIL
jgi:hypothetical protein